MNMTRLCRWSCRLCDCEGESADPVGMWTHHYLIAHRRPLWLHK